MSALAVTVPRFAPSGRPARRIGHDHLQLVGPGFTPDPGSVVGARGAASSDVELEHPGQLRAVPNAAVPSAAAPATRIRLRLTARGRLLRGVTGFLLATTAVVTLGGWLGSTVAGPQGYDGPLTTVSVTAGETLWGIAAATAGEQQDPRDVVAQIQQLNSLPDADLVAGQQLLVPAG